MIDKTENPAEIYLVPLFDGDHDHVWCDTPAPGKGMREEDATRYVREDIYLALKAQVEAWKAISGKHLEVASDCIESNRRLLLKTFIAGCDVGHKYGDNPFEHDRQFDNFMADLKSEKQNFDEQEIEFQNFLNRSIEAACAKERNTRSNPVITTLIGYLERQIAFSLNTFGPAKRTGGIIDHMKKELVEVAADPDDLTEWIDLVMLALDGAWRHVDRTGMSFTQVAELVQKTLTEKLAKNEARSWPDWRTLSDDKAIEHNRSVDELAAKEGL